MKNVYILLMLLAGSIGSLYSQPKTKEIRYTQAAGSEFSQTIVHTDGMGRAKQTIGIGASPMGNDVVSFALYDCMGRGDSISYLPYTVSTSGAMRSNPKNEQQNFYNTMFPGDADASYAYSRKQYDTGLGLVQSAKGVGQNAHTYPVQYEYRLNSSSDAIRKYVMSTNDRDMVFSGYYAANELTIVRGWQTFSQSELNTESYEYKNALGQLVAKEARLSGGERRITYYVYDEMGRQRYIIPPILESTITTANAAYSYENLKKYCFYNEYDKYGNVVKQFVPGMDPVYNVYDSRNRLVMSQNGNQRPSNTWSYTKYDIHDRPVYSGTVVATDSPESHTTAALNQTAYGETTGGAVHGYTNMTYPMSGVSANNVLAVTYYDNYQWLSGTTHQFSSTNALGNTPVYDNIKGLVTGTLTKVLDLNASTPQWLKSVVYFDNECRTIQTVADLYPSGQEITSNKHNFTGEVVQTRVVQTVGSQSYSYDKWFTIDKCGRLQKVEQQIAGDAVNGKVTLASYEYNELGNVKQEQIHNNLETTTKEYRVSGALTGSISPSFSYKLGFDRAADMGLSALPNGNLAHVVWGAGANLNKGYQFAYYKTGEMNTANYWEKPGSSWQPTSKYSEAASYDSNGNILTMSRTSSSGSSLHSLAMNYNGTNVLQSISGYGGAFTYDANGNMTKDGQTGVQIEYNLLNLPQRIFAGTDEIRYIYSADGTKLASVVGSSSTYYRSVMTYAKNGSAAEQLVQIATQGGSIAQEGNNFVYKYFKTDHLGNTRVLLAARGGTLQEEQRTDYYPYGLAHSLNNLHLNRYLYSGKELQDASIGSLGLLGLYDFGSRYYNPVLGRWFNIDPALQGLNPYLYCANSPMMFVDPDGEFFVPMLIGAAIGVITNGVGNLINDQPFFAGAGQAAFMGAIGGAMSFGIGEIAQGMSRFGGIAFQTMAHAHLGGMMTGASGGNPFSGMLAGAFGSLAATGTGALLSNADRGVRALGILGSGALIGGVGADIAGGSFWDGFRNGAISGGLNHAIHMGLFGPNLMAASMTGLTRHLFGPDAIAVSGTLDASAIASLGLEKGGLYILHGDEKGWYSYNDLGIGLGGLEASVGGKFTRFYSSASEVLKDQFYGVRVEGNASASVACISPGVSMSYSKHQDGGGYTLGFGMSIGVSPIPLMLNGNLNKGMTTEKFKELKDIKNAFKPAK